MLQLRPDATVDWWCAPRMDGPPLCWQLLDPAGGRAEFPGLVAEGEALDDRPAGPTARTLLGSPAGPLEVWDGLLPTLAGVRLVRLLRAHRRPVAAGEVVEHALAIGGFDASVTALTVADRRAHVTLAPADGAGDLHVTVQADGHAVHDGVVRSSLRLADQGWSALTVTVEKGVTDQDEGPAEPAALAAALQADEDRSEADLRRARLPRRLPGRVTDALRVLQACT